MAVSYNQILADLKRKTYHPIYMLCGEEPYFIDLLCHVFENQILSADEKEFNQTILYGRDVDAQTIMEYAKRYPMMASHQVVIVKEAQDVKTIDDLVTYAEKPLSSTILVLCYKYKKYDKRKVLAKKIEAKGVYFESARIYTDKLPDWITSLVESKGYTISRKAAQLLADFLGNDLSKISNETGKLFINLPQGSKIGEELIEQNIGISKDFNIFELQSALGTRDILKANRIVNHFASNPKDNPLIKNVIMLNSYFSKLILYHALPDKSDKTVIAELGVYYSFVNDYHQAARNYSFQKLTEIISLLREYDMKSKGMDNASADDGELMKELIYKILH
ncbi:MAG: DNA polymerase III subunit delta [Lentimicrobiaceae bacterium]|nr:DNA polymerase III subunit delta [Lentimicrobiaceae bacterium]MCB9023896.1 DNA polymerase III subunit delta [Lentimicrobiaceae bacterium]MCO5266195.1 DNA polymerase III subunit delta [Lentimicrobium sp.]